jgi:hypothetical protein
MADITSRPVNTHIGPIKNNNRIRPIVTSPYFRKPKEAVNNNAKIDNLVERIRMQTETTLKQQQQDVEITDRLCREFNIQLQKAVDQIAQNLGLSCIKLGTIGYHRYELTMNIQAFGTFHNPDGSIKSKEQLQWERYCGMYGLPKSAYNKEFVFDEDDEYSNQRAWFYDIQTIKRLYPIIVKFENGELAGISADTAKKYI